MQEEIKLKRHTVMMTEEAHDRLREITKESPVNQWRTLSAILMTADLEDRGLKTAIGAMRSSQAANKKEAKKIASAVSQVAEDLSPGEIIEALKQAAKEKANK